MEFKKPTNCNVNWLDMTPTKGGRTCHDCQKVIVDFSKKSWNEIYETQQEHNFSLCGMYSNKQLDNWGKDVSKGKSCKTPLILASMLVSLNAVGNIDTQPLNDEIELHEVEQLESINRILKNRQDTSITPDTITIQIIDSLTKEPLPGCHIRNLDNRFGVITDEIGEIRIDLDKLERRDSLKISYIGYFDKIISIQELSETRTVELNSLIFSITNLTAFYVRKPTRKQRFKNWIRNLFR